MQAGSKQPRQLETIFLTDVELYIEELSPSESANLDSRLDSMVIGDFGSVHTKPLRGKIYELIMGSHRFVYFIHKETIYFVRAFRKKTQKTPRDVIDYADAVYKTVTAT